MTEGPIRDLLVIGGGINGCGIARDAAGRGLSVLLCETDDLAAGTSSASTKLIHGGLRYLEHFEFRLVRASLTEREVLLRNAPHIIWPLRFVLPHDSGQRPAWMIRLGLFLYDHLGGREILPRSESLDLSHGDYGAPLAPAFRRGFAYSDCWVDDARLVVLNALDASERGAAVRTRTELVSARRDGTLWIAELRDRRTGRSETVRARALVNAAGPWAAEILHGRLGEPGEPELRLVKGSHIVVPRLYAGEHAYIFQNPDKRVVFAIPYESDFTLIGTTELDYRGDPAAAEIEDLEIDYLLAVIARCFRKTVGREAIVWSFSGVRPLYDDRHRSASAVTRDYVFDLDAPRDEAPLLSIFGGKITTYRKLAEHALTRLQPRLGFSERRWTAAAPLPGGDIPGADFAAFLADLRRRRPWLPEPLARRYARAYGTRVERLLGGANALVDLGADLGEGLYEAELEYLRAQEWAVTMEDLLWRRSKLGLHISAATRGRLAEWLGEAGPQVSAHDRAAK
ncbi:MAG TPA: glycerol-3-phosphate dehydrogenase [Kiloniellales bacterium]|nr:glycerol-3-phosphate dehydrogenase [Kiloniellales bacterium]